MPRIMFYFEDLDYDESISYEFCLTTYCTTIGSSSMQSLAYQYINTATNSEADEWSTSDQ